MHDDRHEGPVYALHRVFRLTDDERPRAEQHESGRDDAAGDEPSGQATLRRMVPTHAGG
jgi:hypothetical protein